MKDLNKTPIEDRYARKCDITGEGMNEGFCINDGMMYIEKREDMIKHLRREFPALYHLNDEDLMETCYNNEYYYWTDWYETLEEMDEWYTIEGELVEYKIN